MAAKTYNLVFTGYKWQKNLPNQAGIYLTYTVVMDKVSKKYNLDELVYIGESKDIKGRQDEHIKAGEYPSDRLLAYAYALLPEDEDSRKRCEAALIYKVKPKWNRVGKDSFNHDTTTVNSTGDHSGVPDSFTVDRTE